MAERMMGGFGMPKMEMSKCVGWNDKCIVMPFGGDPFKNDPFFAGSGFGRIDNMMQEMRSEMKRAMAGGM